MSANQPLDLFDSEVAYALSGIPVMMLNPLFDGKFKDPKKSIPKVISYYKKNKIPMMWYLSPDGKSKGYGDIISQQGLELAVMQVPGMAANLSEISTEILEHHVNKSQVSVEMVTEELHEVNAEIVLKAFNIDQSIFAPMQKHQKDLSDKGLIDAFIAAFNGRFGSTSTVFYEDEVAGIYDVATLEDMRGHGLATAVVAKCMLEAKIRGYQIIILQSTPLGHPVYLKLGFKDFFTYDRYLLRPEMLK